MKKLVCDLCGKELNVRDCYDEDGYSQYVNVVIQDSRTYGAEYDICNTCYEDILKYAKERALNDQNRQSSSGSDTSD